EVARVAALAAAMGRQAAAVRRLGKMSTTYLTSPLTALVAGLVTGSKPDGTARSVGVLATLVVGAIAASLVLEEARAWLPLVILVPVALVIVASVAGFEWVRDHLTPGRGRSAAAQQHRDGQCRRGRQRDQRGKLVAPVELEDVGGEQRRHAGGEEQRAGEGRGALRRGSPAAQRGEATGQPGDQGEREQRGRGGAATQPGGAQGAGQRVEYRRGPPPGDRAGPEPPPRAAR